MAKPNRTEQKKKSKPKPNKRLRKNNVPWGGGGGGKNEREKLSNLQIEPLLILPSEKIIYYKIIDGVH